MRDVNSSQIRTWKRIIAAFHGAKTDNELIDAMLLTQTLADSMVQMQEMAERREVRRLFKSKDARS
jgi:hypothetical protein